MTWDLFFLLLLLHRPVVLTTAQRCEANLTKHTLSTHFFPLGYYYYRFSIPCWLLPISFDRPLDSIDVYYLIHIALKVKTLNL